MGSNPFRDYWGPACFRFIGAVYQMACHFGSLRPFHSLCSPPGLHRVLPDADHGLSPALPPGPRISRGECHYRVVTTDCSECPRRRPGCLFEHKNHQGSEPFGHPAADSFSRRHPWLADPLPHPVVCPGPDAVQSDRENCNGPAAHDISSTAYQVRGRKIFYDTAGSPQGRIGKYITAQPSTQPPARLISETYFKWKKTSDRRNGSGNFPAD